MNLKSTSIKNSLFPALLILIFLVLAGFNSFYENEERSVYTHLEDNLDWKKVKDGVKITPFDVLITYKKQLGLGSDDQLLKMREETDQQGNSHLRYQHFHKSVKVEGSQLLIHTRNNFVYLVNGTLIKNLDQEKEIILGAEEAIQIAKELVPAEKYMWESEWAERLIKRIKKDDLATNYPEAELVYVHPSFDRNSTDYSLAYDIMIHSLVPEKRERYFVSATTGEILLNIDMMHTGSTPAIAETRYHGTRTIIVDSVAPDLYRLVDTTRAAGVETYNALNGTNMENAVDFTDEDNYWNNFNAAQDEVATDVHFGAEKTFDLYGTLGQYGLNGDTLPFLSFVHVNEDWTNATWNGMFARFGDASPPDSPLAALDVVGHEFTHGLTDFTADLVYMDESGALNESFSDIFGTALEFYADSATADWYIGEDFINSGGFRYMADPQSFGDPDTYQGFFWVTGSGDNGGVHTNSGVQNYWNYLLTEGGQGINDNGDFYEIEGVGIDTSLKISYGNLKNYLMVNSQYSDARMGSIQSAIDIYGECSFPVVQTTNAWYACGVGNKHPFTDFELLDILGPDSLTCGVTDQEIISVRLRYNECDIILPPGTKVPLTYQIDEGDLVSDTLIVPTDLVPGDSLIFNFAQPIADFINPGTYKLTVRVDFEGDNRTDNDMIRNSFERIYEQNTDIALNRVVSPVSSCFMAEENVVLALQFQGCDSIMAGETMELHYRIDDGAWVIQDYTLDSILYRGEEILVELDGTVDFNEVREYMFDAQVIYDLDTVNYNDQSLENLVDNPDSLEFRVIMTFEGMGTSSLDSFFTIEGLQTEIGIEDTVGFKVTKGLKITGNNGIQAIVDEEAEIPQFDNVWHINEDYRSMNCFCADLRNTNEARLKFRINQSYSPIYEDLYGNPLKYASTARILLNGEQFGANYVANNSTGSPYYLQNLNIEDYTGATLEICFETATLTSSENDPYGIGDNVHIDDVVLIADYVVNTSEEEITAFTLFPNPAKNSVTIQFFDQSSSDLDVQIFDIQGRLVLRNTVAKTSNSKTIQLDNLSSGLYFVQTLQDNVRSTQKLIIE